MQIKELKIYSSRIKEQADFYARVLGLEIIKQSEKLVSFTFGETILHIEFKAEATPYHFAINIPSNKDAEALMWLKSKVTILKNGNKEIQDFEDWNARAIYFYDMDNNLVEFIARKNLNIITNEIFDVNQILEISEIGLPTIDIEKEFNQLSSLTGIEIYDGGFDRFCALGDEQGLFICIDKNVKDWFPTNDKAFSSDFEIRFIEKGNEYQLAYKDEEIREPKRKL